MNRDKRLTFRIDKFTDERLMKTADDLKMSKSRIVCFIIYCFLSAYDRKVMKKFTPLPNDLLVDVFQIDKYRKDVARAVGVVQNIQAKKFRANGGKGKENIGIDEEIRQMFSSFQEEGAKMEFSADVNKRA